MAQIKKLASRQHHYFTLNVNEVADSVSVNNNTSDVSYSFVLSPKVKGYDWSIGNQITYTITINGSTVYTGHIPSYNGTSTVTLKSGTITIPHNNDGAKTIDIGFNVTDSTSYSFTCGNASGSDNLVLTTIARATKIISATPVNIGKNTSISFNKYNDNFTQSVYYRKKGDGPNDWITIVEKTSSSPYSWQIPTSLYAEIPNSPSIKLEFYAKTFNGNVDLGNSDIIEQTFTATDEDDDFPTITSSSVVSIDTTTTNLVGSSRMIRYISTVQVTITANAKNSSSISSITINNVDAELTTSGTSKTGVATFTKSPTYSYQVVVTDSRGNSITSSYSITWTNYIPLTLNVTLSRNEPTDGKVNISFSGNYFNSSFRKSDDTNVSNTLTVQYTSREAGGSWGSWTTISHTKSGNTYSGSIQLSNYDYTKQYEFQMKAVDQVSTIPQNGIVVSKGQPIYWWNDSSFNVTEDINAKKKIIIPKSSSTGTTGIYNDAGQIVFQSYANNNSILNAGGGGLYLGYQNTNGINFLNSKTLITGAGSIFLNTTKTYLYKNADPASWYNARDCCLVRSYITSGSSSWFPILSMKTKSGDWSLGSRGNTDIISLSYILDTNYSSSTNTKTYNIDFPTATGTLALTSDLTQNVLSARPSANVAVSSTGFQKLTLNTQIFKNGSNLSIANGGILIGAGITKVFVSGSVYFYANTQAGDSLRVAIYKNSTLVVENFARAGTTGTYEHRVITPFPITVAEGDYIYLYYANSTSARGSVASSVTDTYLLVQEIK